MWACTYCTFENEKEKDKCEICDNKRDNKKRKREEAIEMKSTNEEETKKTINKEIKEKKNAFVTMMGKNQNLIKQRPSDIAESDDKRSLIRFLPKGLIIPEKSVDDLNLWKFHTSEMKVEMLKDVPGVVILRSFLSLEIQNQIVQFLQDNIEHCKIPYFETTKSYGYLYMMSIGKSIHGYSIRKEGMPPPPIPDLFLKLYTETLGHKLCTNLFPSAIAELPNRALLNYYPPEWGKLGKHQDKGEKLLPVWSASIGDSCNFDIWDITKAKGKVNVANPGEKHTIFLRSGDVVVFGNENRLMFHEIPIKGFKQNHRPQGLLMAPGRINLTLRHAE